MRISDWSSDVCSSDLAHHGGSTGEIQHLRVGRGRARQAHDPTRRRPHAARDDRTRTDGGEHGRAPPRRGPPGDRVRSVQRGQRGGVARSARKIGRASWRDRVWQYGWIRGDAVSEKKKPENKITK